MVEEQFSCLFCQDLLSCQDVACHLREAVYYNQNSVHGAIFGESVDEVQAD